ncbi:nucleotidyltransferase family protein [Rathayibacter caricis]|uniref:nucleotidyltransferase family protein n=1 Tax=Rathayibacter caricis TaxID=110936 RepID=UPI001FB397BE|nr:nucleotidyltransferase family protein [Rathayibacter caricis]MCJ1694910.1 nucleotidyltransferase family protein [Rathayibacter caricis]
MTRTADLPLPVDVAVALVHALVQAVARSADLRVLFIKGPVADAHRIRRPHASSDVDVLVDPRDADRLIGLLEGLGWSLRPESAAHRAFVTHSVSLLHESWPCDIDVHRDYPGFFVDPLAAFEVLWASRCELSIASVPIQSTGFESAVLVSALHSLRSPYLPRSGVELDELVASLGDDYRAESLADLATALGCLEPISPFFERLGIPVALPQRPSHDYTLWLLRARRLTRTASWMVAIAEATDIRERLSLLRLALLPTIRDIEIDHPATGPNRAARLRIRAKRLRDGALAFPSAVLDLLTERRAARGRVGLIEVPGSVPQVRGEVVHALSDHRPPPVSTGEEQRTPPALDPDSIDTTAGRTGAAAVASVAAPDALYLLPLDDLQKARPRVLAGSARILWELLDESGEPGRYDARKVQEAAAEIFSVTSDLIARHIELFVIELAEAGLLPHS